jgi:lipopolysaccharide heptosyltransferase II
MSTPALLRLRESKPGARIGLLTLEGLADLWANHPVIDEVIPFSRNEGAGSVSRRIREQNFQTALILPNSFRSAIESWLAGVPERVGHAGGGRGFLLTRRVPRRAESRRMRKRTPAQVRELVLQFPEKPRDSYPPEAHQIHEYLHLAGALGADPTPTAPRIHLLPSEIEQFRLRCKLEPGSKKVLGVNPGAQYGPAKRWPTERFVETIRAVRRSVASRILIFGGKTDIGLAAEIHAAIGDPKDDVLNLAGNTSLRELAAGLALCDLVLTNDSGPMHLAAAVGTRVVVPFGGTSPELTGPGLPGASHHLISRGAAPCAPCFLRECPIDFRCMKSILPEEIANRIFAALRE